MNRIYKKNKISAIFFAVITILLTVFIFSNSLTVGEESGKMSDVFVDIFEKILSFFGISSDRYILGVIIRKGAHFSEYLLLGFSLSSALSYFGKNFITAISVLYSAVVAFCDEFVMQAMTKGRAPMFGDVLIDISGALVGFLLVLAIISAIKRKEKKI